MTALAIAIVGTLAVIAAWHVSLRRLSALHVSAESKVLRDETSQLKSELEAVRKRLDPLERAVRDERLVRAVRP